VKRLLAALAGVAALAACDEGGEEGEGATLAETPVEVVAKWDAKPQGEVWTEATLEALRSHGAELVEMVPEDVEAWCPAYPEASTEEREAFWVGLISALAEHESTWRPDAVGGDGRWFGLVQISPATARGYGCRATTGDALKDGSANLSCAIRIWADTVTRDGVVAANFEGIAADWGPFHQARKRSAMREWVSQQDYCQK